MLSSTSSSSPSHSTAEAGLNVLFHKIPYNEMTSTSQPSTAKSKYRGVYRCGRKWKAQLQSQGIQYYLGTFDTEEEAAKAYDLKAKGEKGFKSLTNFDDDGHESRVYSHVPGVYVPAHRKSTSSKSSTGINVTSDSMKHHLFSDAQKTQSSANPIVNADALHQIWERLCQVTQRLILAKVTNDSLVEVYRVSPDEENERLLHGLKEEIVLLNIVKTQLEEAISKAVAQGLLVISDVSALSPIHIDHNEATPASCQAVESYEDKGKCSDTVDKPVSALPPFGSAFNHNPPANT